VGCAAFSKRDLIGARQTPSIMINSRNHTEGANCAQEFKQGDKVEWNTPQGKTRGTVKKKLTSDTEVGGQKINASEDDPRYLVESEKSGKEAAHKADALSKV
jgi:hypothetical protein